MSYRDLRNLSEILRTVGYPRLVSLENFRTPNFRLVADIGIWMVHQYDPKADFPTLIDTEHNRVIFIRSFAEFMATKVQLKLNTKRLYQADGYAVKELIKVALVLHSAMKDAEKMEFRSNGGESTDLDTINHFDISSKLDSLKRTRALASEITQRGVSLYDMLSKEISLREVRQFALSKAFEMSEVERLLNSALAASSAESKKLKSMLEGVDGNIVSVNLKIEKKKQELERSQKRLQTLKKVRPAFMDEYEKLQGELAQVYKVYVNRFKSLSYLQTQMEEINRIEMERKAEELNERKELGAAPKGEDFLFLRNRPNDNSNDSEDESEEEEEKPRGPREGAPPGASSRLQGRPTAGTAGSRQMALAKRGSAMTSTNTLSRQIGSMSMLGSHGDESGESESDLILIDGENSDLEDEDNDEEKFNMELGNELSVQNAAIRMARTMGIPASMQDQFEGGGGRKHAIPPGNGGAEPRNTATANSINQKKPYHEMTNGHLLRGAGDQPQPQPQPSTSKSFTNGPSLSSVQGPSSSSSIANGSGPPGAQKNMRRVPNNSEMMGRKQSSLNLNLISNRELSGEKSLDDDDF